MRGPDGIPDSMPLEIEVRRTEPGRPWTYSLLDTRQRQVAERARAGGPGALLLSEVDPVITLGRRTPQADLLVPAHELEARGIGVHRTDRGGLATYHGPGQWVLFVVDRLDRLTGDRRGVRRAVEGLLTVGQKVGCSYDPETHVREGCETGVWGSRGKIASVGVHIEGGVLLHGLALNGFATPTSFFGLRPCGLDAMPQFLLQGGPRAAAQAFSGLGERLASEVREVFGCAFASGGCQTRLLDGLPGSAL